MPAAPTITTESPPKLPHNTDQARWFSDEVLPHEPALRGYLRSQFPSIEADDVVQESYLKLFRVSSARRIASTKAYLFSIARNTALTVFRRRQIYSDVPVNESGGLSVLNETCRATPHTPDAYERLDLVIAAIDGLPARCREIVELTALEGLSSAEIACQLGLSESTVRVQLARGIKKCEAFLRTESEL